MRRIVEEWFVEMIAPLRPSCGNVCGWDCVCVWVKCYNATIYVPYAVCCGTLRYAMPSFFLGLCVEAARVRLHAGISYFGCAWKIGIYYVYVVLCAWKNLRWRKLVIFEVLICCCSRNYNNCRWSRESWLSLCVRLLATLILECLALAAYNREMWIHERTRFMLYFISDHYNNKGSVGMTAVIRSGMRCFLAVRKKFEGLSILPIEMVCWLSRVNESWLRRWEGSVAKLWLRGQTLCWCQISDHCWELQFSEWKIYVSTSFLYTEKYFASNFHYLFEKTGTIQDL